MLNCIFFFGPYFEAKSQVKLHFFFRPYFEAKSQVNQQLDYQKQKVRQLELEVTKAKDTYSSALNALETISDQIHKVGC